MKFQIRLDCTLFIGGAIIPGNTADWESMDPKTVLGWMGSALAGVVYVQAIGAGAVMSVAAAPRPQSALMSRPLSSYRALLNRYCVGCHNQVQQTAGLELDSIDIADVGDNAKMWEKVVEKLRTRAMPPPGSARPDEASYAALRSWLEGALDSAAVASPNPGRPAVHRLNRTEYANVIRDLLALEIDSRSLLPADDLAYGFDNIADTLSFSPLLLERYLAAAKKISRLAVGDPSIVPALETYEVSPLLVQDGRMSDELPFGSAGGLAIRHHFPLDGEYVLQVRLQRRRVRQHRQLDIRLDGKRIKLIKLEGGDRSSAYGQPVAEDPQVRFSAGAGTRIVGVSFLSSASVPEGVRPLRVPVGSLRGGFTDWGVSSVQIDGSYRAQGPGETPSRQRIFICRPASNEVEPELMCARKILATLARRAYRRPVTNDDVLTLLEFYRMGRSQGDFETGVQLAIERILVDPEFLFRIEREPASAAPSTAFYLRDVELASRLSFFLWSSIPDDELLAVAEDGELRDPAVLEYQVRRMLADARSNALVSNFAAQWLHLRNLRAVTPDVNRYPEWDDNLRRALQRETELFLDSHLRQDRSMVDLLASGDTFINERLARHYGIPNVYGERFRKVTFSEGRRGGLLGQGSILTVTSYANRTSPVLRGKWVLENILGIAVPPPPADVPELAESPGHGKPASLRERLEQHTKNPACASCHTRMDPLGFALENFDAIGRWRTTDEDDNPIQASGTLPDGTTFEGPLELRHLLLSRRHEFVATVTRKLLTYAIGRGTEYYDLPAVRAIMREAAASDYRWSSIILGIAKSLPFQMKRSRP